VKGNHDARPVLWNHCRGFFRRDMGLHQGLRPAVAEASMDYIIAGIVTVLLFVYLIYALLRPERF
jgi:K+-transporting ATPase KdpF subunit